MRTKDPSTSLMGDFIPDDDDLQSFLGGLAEFVQKYEQESGQHLSINVSARISHGGQYHFVPFAYCRDTTPLCLSVKGAAHECLVHKHGHEVPDFLNTMDMAQSVNAYVPYDSNHAKLLLESSASRFAGVDENGETVVGERFNLLHGEAILRNEINPKSILNGPAGKIGFWRGMKAVAEKAMEHAEPPAEVKQALDPLITALAKTLGVDPASIELAPFSSLTSSSDGSNVPDHVEAAMERAVKEVEETGVTGLGTTLTPEEVLNDPDAPEDVKAMARMAQEMGANVRVVRINPDSIPEVKGGTVKGNTTVH